MSQLSSSHLNASAAFRKVQKQSVTRDRILADIEDANTARISNMNKLRTLRMARDQQEARARAAAVALPKTRTRRTRVG